MASPNLNARHARHLRTAERLKARGRNRVLWINGVLYFGGSLFVLFNAVDFLLEPAARPTAAALLWFLLITAACVVFGYLYGLYLWRHIAHVLRRGETP